MTTSNLFKEALSFKDVKELVMAGMVERLDKLLTTKEWIRVVG